MSERTESEFRGAVLMLFAPGLSVETYPARASKFMRALVDCDIATYSELDLARNVMVIRFDVPNAGQDACVAGFAQHMAGHEFTRFDPNVAGGGPFMRANYLTHRQFRDTGVYREGFILGGINDHSAIPVNSPDGKILFTCMERSGKGVFRVEELEIMRQMQPFLSNARELAVAASTLLPLDAEPGMLGELGLTPRKADVLFWIVQGKTNPEVAIILGISVQTVKEYVSLIFSKLGVETRHAAAMRGLEALRMAVLSRREDEGRAVQVPAPPEVLPPRR